MQKIKKMCVLSALWRSKDGLLIDIVPERRDFLGLVSSSPKSTSLQVSTPGWRVFLNIHLDCRSSAVYLIQASVKIRRSRSMAEGRKKATYRHYGTEIWHASPAGSIR